MTDKEYYADKSRLTNTMLGWIIVGAKYFKKQLALMGLKKDSEESYLIFGNAVHCRLLEINEFVKKYFIKKYDAPSNVVQKKFCSILISHSKSDNAALRMAYRMSYKMSYASTKMIDEVIDKKAKVLYNIYRNYIIQQKANFDKIKLSKNDFIKIQSIENNVKYHKRANELLYMKGSKHIIVENEKIIEWEFLDMKMKSKLDRFIIDFKAKKIFLIDVKTHSSKKENVKFTDSFSKSFWFFNYDRQLYMYSMALVYYFIKNFGEDHNIDDFILEQKIVAIQSNYDHDVKVFNITESFMDSGEKKFNNAIRIYNYYKENGYKYDHTIDKNYEEELNDERLY